MKIRHVVLGVLFLFVFASCIFQFHNQAELNALAKSCEQEIHDTFEAVQKVAPSEMQLYTSLVKKQQSYLERRDSHQNWVNVDAIICVCIFYYFLQLYIDRER